jgi:hypothetical protein
MGMSEEFEKFIACLNDELDRLKTRMFTSDDIDALKVIMRMKAAALVTNERVQEICKQ